MNKPVKAILLGLFTGILGILASLVPFVLDLEEKAGLDWLFTLRGPRTPPSDVVVVAVDKPSADTLGLPVEPDKWPRLLHAQLIDRLVEAGASVIVLDIFFAEARNAGDDAALAAAIGKAGNVVLFAYTKKELSTPAGNSAGELIVQRLITPVSPIAQSALALAPFPLPVFPVKVSQFWTFTPSTGDLPTLPLVALQLHAATAYPDLLELINRSERSDERPLAGTARDLFSGHGAVAAMQALRSVFVEEPLLGQRLTTALSDESQHHVSARKQRLLRALIGMYDDGDSRYLNFYGPAQSITTLSYVRVLQPDIVSVQPQMPVDLHGKAVFVGYSERLQPERLDEFYTAFSQNNGVHLSGVEIAATAFANLLENLPVTPLPRPAGFLLLLAWGLLIGAVARLLPALPAVAATAALAGLYLGAAHVTFSHFAVWPPLLVPLFLQAPFALFSATLWHYLEVRREREHIRTAFGYYLPSPVVDRLASEMAGGRDGGTADVRHLPVFGCRTLHPPLGRPGAGSAGRTDEPLLRVAVHAGPAAGGHHLGYRRRRHAGPVGIPHTKACHAPQRPGGRPADQRDPQSPEPGSVATDACHAARSAQRRNNAGQHRRYRSLRIPRSRRYREFRQPDTGTEQGAWNPGAAVSAGPGRYRWLSDT